ncbi:cysteine peptidase family C39 domain-containing protein [Endozoicomonas sp. SCSIO W0465]|nr:cysteine peptidase family C39 domain-containing protein [Endozoicomonas sp. SCSIO W0465]
MLIHQHNRCFSVCDLKSTNLGDNSFIFQALSNAGLSPFQTRFANLDELTSAVKQDGPAIVTVNNGMGLHSIVVDAVTDTSVLIRDPFHGWEVEIGRAAFAKSWDTDDNAIQVR